MEISFYKYHGTGNDFIILDNRDGRYSQLTVEQIALMCNRRFGIGADGLMLLEVEEGFDFKMKYHNADGKEGSMCGNGGRCLVQFAKDQGISKDKYLFIATDGPHEASIQENGWIRLKMKDVDNITLSDADYVLNTGSPHLVRWVDDMTTLNVFEEGRNIRYNETYQQDGININFVKKLENGIQVRTYERGVEDETLSCGTGVTASAIAAAKNLGDNHVHVKVEGGALEVMFHKINDNQFSDIWLIGPATFVFTGKYTTDV